MINSQRHKFRSTLPRNRRQRCVSRCCPSNRDNRQWPKNFHQQRRKQNCKNFPKHVIHQRNCPQFRTFCFCYQNTRQGIIAKTRPYRQPIKQSVTAAKKESNNIATYVTTIVTSGNSHRFLLVFLILPKSSRF